MVCASTSQRRQRRRSAQAAAAAAASQAAVPTTGAAARCRPSYHLHECARQRHEQVRAARELEAAARRPRPGCFRQRGRGPNRRSARHLPSLALPPSLTVWRTRDCRQPPEGLLPPTCPPMGPNCGPLSRGLRPPLSWCVWRRRCPAAAAARDGVRAARGRCGSSARIRILSSRLMGDRVPQRARSKRRI